MKIYILEIDKKKANVFKDVFKSEDVEVVCGDFENFMKKNKVECIVSPANSYGLMDGGYDLAITNWFGEQLQKRVQKYILDNFYGEQPVGTSFIIDAGKDNQKLIHTPTMRVPSKIIDASIIYQCMRTTLITAIESNVKSIVIPVFGGLTGGISDLTAAKLMWLGYKQIMSPNETIDWDVVWDMDDKWIELGLKRR
jgi:O-acetyl-ADP-ribose deacetylase (regulator of RNase III)